MSRWAAARRATSALVCVPRARHRKRGCIRVAISSRRIGLWQLGTTDGEAQRTPLVCLRAQLPRIPLPPTLVNRRYDARSADDPGYTDTVREDFDLR